ncbi:DNA polymerase I B [Hirschfeldia incana]|nr:DNA polymerase I B [Hirschfeldia incana]
MGVSLRHFSPSSFLLSRRPRSASSSVLSFLLPRHRIPTRKIAITNGTARYCTATASGGSHGFRQGSSTVEFSGEWKLSVGSKTAIMVPPTMVKTGAVSAWGKGGVNQFGERNRENAKNQDDASGNYFRSFVPKMDDVQFYQTLEHQLEPRGDVTTVDREINGFAQQKSLRRPVLALPRKDGEKIDDKDVRGRQRPLVASFDGERNEKTVTISKVGKRTDLSKVRANLTKIYNRVRVVDNVSTAKEIVAKLVNQYRDLVHACDTEVSRIDVKTETPVDHGELICFSIYCGSEADFGDGKSCIWVDVLGDNGKDILAEFKPFFEDSSIKKVWHNYSFDNHIIRNYGIKLSGFHGDTMHMARLWDSSRRTSGGYSLEALTSDPRVLGGTDTKEEAELFGKISMKTIFGKGKLKKDGTEGKLVVIPPVEELQRDDREAWISYSALDSISTLKLYESMKKQLQAKKWFLDGKVVSGKNMFDFYQEYWQPFGEVLATMEAEGMLVDRDYLAQIEIVAKGEQEIAVSRFRSWASKHCPDAKHMNVGSDTQLRQLFFGGISNSCNDEDLPYEKMFKVLNVDNVIEEGKKKATKFRNIKLHRISDNPLPAERFTPSGWPSVSGDTLKALAGKVSAAYDFTEVAADDNSLEENIGDEEFMSLPDETLEAQNSDTSSVESDTSAFGTAFDAFGGGESGKEACHAIASLCEVCSIDSLISNFILPLQGSNVSGKDGRVHCSLNINTETGRLSARRPNLQNQPALEKDRYKIRQAFIASPGNSLIVADYGQLELRILAHLARCKSMMEAFVAGGDFHSRTAMNMYPHIREAVENGEVLLEWHPQPGQEKPPVPLLKDAFASERRKAKMLNFSIAYGKTAVGLSRDWKVSVEEAQETVDLWYNDRQEVRKWQELRKKEAIQNGYVLTLLGRARKFPAYRSRAQKNHIQRAAINTPVQGSAADVAMCAMLEITTNERLKELGWKLLLQVHDEVILEGPSESAEIAKAIVVDCMCKPFNGKNILSVDLSVDAKCAQNWYAAK